ncbi:MAG: hypothetical protein B6241_13115 [Spirochaetaceae bacterium 4572_59]|nr:MAG: hypothetical protein B6241_13115 [Spirochaetaceae bacterium 4572_59]
MRKIWIKTIPVLLGALLLSGCFSMPAGGNFSLSAIAGDKIASAIGMDDMALQMEAMEFYALYASYGFYGAYNYESGFPEGEGCRWQYISEDKENTTNNSEYERVFLKDMGDGSGWWRISVFDEENDAEYEYLLSSESDFLAIRFRDDESGEIVEIIPEQYEESEMDEARAEEAKDNSEMDEEDMAIYDSLEYSQYSMGSEKITVGAGEFTAEHMVSEYKDSSDPENPMNIRSDWWIVESVPGGVVKYVWTNIEEDSSLSSELSELLSGQKSRLDSY